MNITRTKSPEQILADYLPDAIFVLDKNGHIIWCNVAAEYIFNYTSIKKQISHIDDLLGIAPFFDLHKDSLGKSLELELPQQPSRRVSVTIRPYLDNILLVAQDITHIDHLEKMRQDFLANVSHELRTPLTVVHGYLETLLDHTIQERPQLETIFKQMYQQTLRMENLVNDLLLLSRLEANVPEECNYQPIDVFTMLETICYEARALSGELQHQFHLQADPSVKIHGLDNELRSAFSNIIFNAVKYTPEQGHITVEWKKENNKALLVVTDTGIGIESNHLPRLTERFYRVDKARSRKSGGTGLGLAIVKHVLIRHKAKLKIESIPGKGSTFICLFPKSLLI